MTNITQEQINNFKKIMKENRTLECNLCGFTSEDSTNFNDEICLQCCRIHEIDY